MVQQVQPEAPFPPPPHPVGMHPGMQQMQADMERMNLQHGVPQYNGHGGSYLPQMDGRYPPQGLTVNTQLPVLNGKVPITYEGYNFTKSEPSRANEKPSWALAVKTKMPVSQDELRTQVNKQKRKGKTVAEQYNDPDMDGYKKKQVDHLIAEKTRAELDPRFEYKLASLKLEQGRTKQRSRQTNSMQVILKRVYRSGDAQPLASGQDRAQELEGEIVDLTSIDDPVYSHSGYSSGSQGLYGAQPHPEYVHPQPYDEHVQAAYYHEQGPAMQAVHPDYIQHPHEHYMQQAEHQPQQPPHQYQEHVLQQQQHHQHQDQHQHHDPHTPDKKDKKDKSEKKDKKKTPAPEVHQKKERKHKSISSSESDGGSSLYTPDTEYSGHSAHDYHHDKKPSSSSRRSSHRESRSNDRDLSPLPQVYRERRRKSPARSTHSGSSEYEVYEVITSDDHDRDRPYRRRTYIRDNRPAFHQRAQSYDDVVESRRGAPVYRQKRLNSYAHPVEEHPHEEKERLKWELEEIRQRQRSEERRQKERENDRLEMHKLELEKARMETEKEKARLARVRLENDYRYDRNDRYDRDERFDRDEGYGRRRASRYEQIAERESSRPAYDSRLRDRY
ncbi:MAG: hypothetical protein Q9195_009579 [Heterodermia aff. obscurata]